MNKKSEKLSLIALALLITGIFWISFTKIFPVDYSKIFEGHNGYLSSSTLKFVNNWLSETPTKLHFLNIESPNSIEFNSLEERRPYISYPSGSTFIVYICAKILGKSNITIYFLKHLQGFFYLISCLIFAFFIFRFLSNLKKTSVFENFTITLVSTVFWMWIPTNTLYLTNTYFADQSIILFVNIFILLEFENYCCKSKKLGIFINIFKSLVVFVGVQIDYYFWILVFVAFALNFIRDFLNKQKLSSMIISSLWYVIPVILSLAFYLYQLMSVPDLIELLKDAFLFRIGVKESKYNQADFLISNLRNNFRYAFGFTDDVWKFVFLFIIILFLVLQNAQYKINDKKLVDKLKSAVLNNNIAIIFIGFFSPILQILLLKNHSAIHEFSMVKLSWCFAILPIVLSCVFLKLYLFNENFAKILKWNFSQFFKLFLLFFIMEEILIYTPISAKEFIKLRQSKTIDFRLAESLLENTEYEHVCFSFSKEIKNNPPYELAVSRKLVYKIDDISEMQTYFKNLNKNAKKVFIIAKDDFEELSENQKNQQNFICNNGKILFENDLFCFVFLSDETIEKIINDAKFSQ